MTTEEWRPVADSAGRYEVSDWGRVRSNIRSPRILSSKSSHPAGYVMVNLYLPAGRRHVHVHHLVLEAFVGPRPDGGYGCHNNGDPTDNRVSNLRWDSPTGNSLDKAVHGTDYNASKTHCGACGLAYDADNTYWHGPDKRWRRCKNCANRYQRTTYHRRKLV